jgi:hypothetical protein
LISDEPEPDERFDHAIGIQGHIDEPFLTLDIETWNIGGQRSRYGLIGSLRLLGPTLLELLFLFLAKIPQRDRYAGHISSREVLPRRLWIVDEGEQVCRAQEWPHRPRVLPYGIGTPSRGELAT